MEHFYITDSGKVRSHNEDSVIIVQNESGEYLMAVCDGMGGHKAGEVASSIAINHIGGRFKKISSLGTKEDATNWLKDIVSEANSLIYKYTLENEDSKGMGTTVVLAVITESYLLFGNIGDSSGYVVKNNKLHKITYDHTLVNLLVKSGDLTEDEAREHPRKNVLMKALGATSTIEMDIFDVEMNISAVMLCSDGLTNMLIDSQINEVLHEDLTAEEKLKKLVVMSNNRGGDDNISVAYLVKEGV